MWEVPVTFKSSSKPEEVTQVWLHLEDESIQMYVQCTTMNCEQISLLLYTTFCFPDRLMLALAGPR